jgi:phosphatidylglycerol:prolipoprotein diacylglycerol transferase
MGTVPVLAILQHPNLDPVIFEIPGTPLALRWYGLMYVLAFTFGYFVLRWLQKTGYLRVKTSEITNVIVYGVLGTFLGGRLGYLLFYQFDKLFLGEGGLTGGERLRMIYAVWEGGMSFHGGVFGVTLAVLLYAWRHKASFWNIMDASVHIVPLGVALVRIGNFINGELPGRIITDEAGKTIYDADKLPWYAMKFPTDTDPDAHRRLMQALRENYIAAHPKAESIPGNALQTIPVNPDVWANVSQYFPGRYPSQIVQFLFEGILVLLLIWGLRRKVKFPGQLAGLFLMLYAIFRIPAEMFRQPDAQIDPANAEQLGGTAAFLHAIGLTMGQFLSVVIFVMGLAIVAWMHIKRRGEPYTPEERRGGFWRETIRDFPEIVGLRKKKSKEEADTGE